MFFNKNRRIIVYRHQEPAFIRSGWTMTKLGWIIGLYAIFSQTMTFFHPSTAEDYKQKCIICGRMLQSNIENEFFVRSFLTHLTKNSCQDALTKNPDSPRIHLELAIAKFFSNDKTYLVNVVKARDLGKQQNDLSVVKYAEAWLNLGTSNFF